MPALVGLTFRTKPNLNEKAIDDGADVLCNAEHDKRTDQGSFMDQQCEALGLCDDPVSVFQPVAGGV